MFNSWEPAILVKTVGDYAYWEQKGKLYKIYLHANDMQKSAVEVN